MKSRASSLDGNLVLVGYYGGATLLNLSAHTVAIGGSGSSQYTSVTINDDLNLLGLNVGVHDLQFFTKAALQDLDYLNSGFLSGTNLGGAKYNASGSLYFVPQAPVGGVARTRAIDIFDIHRQRLVLRVALPEPLIGGLNAMCLDETGSKMFLISKTGITIARLATVPFSVATIAPALASTSATIKIRGSGFQNGAKVKFGSNEASTTVVDAGTIQAVVPSMSSGPTRISVINPDGGQYDFDGGFTAQ